MFLPWLGDLKKSLTTSSEKWMCTRGARGERRVRTHPVKNAKRRGRKRGKRKKRRRKRGRGRKRKEKRGKEEKKNNFLFKSRDWKGS